MLLPAMSPAGATGKPYINITVLCKKSYTCHFYIILWKWQSGYTGLLKPTNIHGNVIHVKNRFYTVPTTLSQYFIGPPLFFNTTWSLLCKRSCNYFKQLSGIVLLASWRIFKPILWMLAHFRSVLCKIPQCFSNVVVCALRRPIHDW